MKKLSLVLILSLSAHCYSMSKVRALSSCRNMRATKTLEAAKTQSLQVPKSYWWDKEHVDSFADLKTVSAECTWNSPKELLVAVKMLEHELSQHAGKTIDDCNRNHFQCMGGIVLDLQQWSTRWLDVMKKLAPSEEWTTQEFFDRLYELDAVAKKKAGSFETAITLVRAAKKLEYELNERTFRTLIPDDERNQFLFFGGVLAALQKWSTERLAELEKLAQTDWYLPEHIKNQQEKEWKRYD